MRLVLDFDDFHCKEPENCLPTLKKYIELVPNIKITLFTTPKHSNFPIEANREWCKEVRKMIEQGNIVLAPHGLTHSHLEFKNLTYKEAANRLRQIKLYFDRAKLPYIPVFKGPNWGINLEVYKALRDQGYTHIFSHEDYKNTSLEGIKTVVYNWNLKDQYVNTILDPLIGHGHTWNVCENGIQETFDKVIEFINKFSPQFTFANEV